MTSWNIKGGFERHARKNKSFSAERTGSAEKLLVFFGENKATVASERVKRELYQPSRIMHILEASESHIQKFRGKVFQPVNFFGSFRLKI